MLLLTGSFLLGATAPLKTLPDMMLKNADGKTVKLTSLKNNKEILVLVFVASSCPVTSLYWERIKGAWYNYRQHKVKMVLVGGNSDDTAAQIRAILEQKDLELPVIWDENHALAKKLGVEFTPEVGVLGRNWEILYRGRIDDSWRDENRVKERHLNTAITAALEGKKTSDRIDEPFMGSHLR